MGEVTAQMIRDFGFPVAIAAFLLWWVRGEIARAQSEALTREKRLSDRLDIVQDKQTNELAGLIRDNATAMMAIAKKPCVLKTQDQG